MYALITMRKVVIKAPGEKNFWILPSSVPK